MDGYNMYTELRNNRKGGGIIMYIHKKHKFRVHNKKTRYFECILGQITTPNKYSATLLAIYRPPSFIKHLFINELHCTLKTVNKNHDLFMLGDVNIDLKISSPIKHKYNTALYNYGLMCGISQYTRIEIANCKLSKTCIDHIYARSRTQGVYTAALGTQLADHRAIVLACIGTGRVRTQDVQTFKGKYNNKVLVSQLQDIDWQNTKHIFCPLKLYSLILKNIKTCYNKSLIQIKIKNDYRRNNNNWMNKKIHTACNYRDKLFIKWLKD
ncbi:unnamed protein product, partial [Parnassius mnemosyne]